MRHLDRRTFIERTLASLAVAPLAGPAARAVGRRRPSETVRIGVVGVRGRGRVHALTWAGIPDVEVAAVCDVDESVIGRTMREVEEMTGRRPAYHADLRRLLDDPSIDAISVATPNHWHSLAGIWAAQAGKDAYVEKPISHDVWEGRQLARAAAKYGRVIAHGTQSRSKKAYVDAMAFLHGGSLGPVRVARGLCYKRRTSIGVKADAPVPEGVRYDIWLGPAPKRPFNPNRFHYEWHWNWTYGNGDIGNQGAHQMDVLRWGLGEAMPPTFVASLGGRFGYDDDGQTPNTQIAVMEYGDVEVVFEVRGLETEGHYNQTTIGNVFHCADGVLVVGNAGSAAFDRDGNELQRFSGGRDDDHFANFIDAVRQGRPDVLNADALDGHVTSTLSHLPNISHVLGERRSLAAGSPFGSRTAGNEAYERMRGHLEANGIDLATATCTLGRPLTFDPETERFTGDGAREANALLRREARAPFTVPEIS